MELSSLEKRTILLNSVFNFGSSLVANFISVYLYIYTNSIPLMCLYIIVRIGCFPIFFALGNKLSKKYPFTLTYSLGLILITIALIYALTGGALFEANPYYVLIAAGIVGSGEGLYYFSANTCNQIVSTDETRASFFSYNGLFSNISALLVPTYASFMLSLDQNEMVGYRRILITIIIIFIMVIFIALTMNKRSEDEGSSLLASLISKDTSWRKHNLAVFIYGLRNGLELNTLSLLIYNAAGSGGVYSKMNILFSLITIVLYRTTKRLFRKGKIEKTFIIGSLIKITSTLVLVIFENIYAAIFFGIANALASVLYDNSYNVCSATVISKSPKEMTARVVTRETYLSAGRIIGMIFVITCFKILPSDIYLKVAVGVLTFAPIFVSKMMLKLIK